MNGSRLARRVFVRAAVMAGVLLTSVMAAVAFGAVTPTLTTTVNTAAPEQGMVAQLTFFGTAAAGADSALYAVARPSGVACGTSYAADQTTSSGVNVTIAPGTAVAASSSYSVPVSWSPSASGPYTVCAWLEQPVSGSAPTVSATQSTAVTVAAPSASIVSVSIPTAPTAKAAFSVQYTTQTDQPLSLFSVIHEASKGGCGVSYAADHAALPDSTPVLGGVSVNGGPIVTSGQATLPAGSFIICTWVQGPTSGEVDAAASTPFSIAVPPPTPKPKPKPKPKPVKAKPALAVTSVIASAAHGIQIRGTTATTFAGTLSVTATCRKAKVTGTASAAAGAFSASLALPAACVTGSQVMVKVHWPGSTTFTPDSAKKVAVVAAPATTTPPVARKPSTPRRTLFTEVRRHQHSVVNVFRTRPSRILVASSPRLVLRLHWTRWNARGGRGHGTAFTRQHHHYRISVLAGHAFHGTFACLTITHRVRGHRRIRRLGLAREGLSLRWVGVRTLHSRHFSGTPWPLHHGCPAVRTTRR